MSERQLSETRSSRASVLSTSSALLPSARTSFLSGTFSTDSATDLASVESTSTVGLIAELLARPELDGKRDVVLFNDFLRALLLRCACSFAFRASGADGSQAQLAELVSTQQYPRYVSRADVRQTEASLHAVLHDRECDLAPSIAEALSYLSPASTSADSSGTVHRAASFHSAFEALRVAGEGAPASSSGAATARPSPDPATPASPLHAAGRPERAFARAPSHPGARRASGEAPPPQPQSHSGSLSTHASRPGSTLAQQVARSAASTLAARDDDDALTATTASGSDAGEAAGAADMPAWPFSLPLDVQREPRGGGAAAVHHHAHNSSPSSLHAQLNLSRAVVERWLSASRPSRRSGSQGSMQDMLLGSPPGERAGGGAPRSADSAAEDDLSCPASSDGGSPHAPRTAASDAHAAATRVHGRRFFRDAAEALAAICGAVRAAAHVLLVQLASSAGVSKAVLRNVRALHAKLPPGAAEVVLIVPPDAPTLHAAANASGFRQVPPLRTRDGASIWARLFRSPTLPTVQVLHCASGRIVCADALPQLQQARAEERFPWRCVAWAARFERCADAALALPCNASVQPAWRDPAARAARSVLLLSTCEPGLPAAAFECLARWAAHFRGADQLTAYHHGGDEPVAALAGHLFLPARLFPDPGGKPEFSACAKHLSPHARHAVHAVDLSDVAPGAPAWRVPRESVTAVACDFTPHHFRRLHAAPALIAVGIDQHKMPALRAALEAAVRLLYAAPAAAGAGAAPAATCDACGRLVHMCYTLLALEGAHHPEPAQTLVGQLVRDAAADGGAAALVVLSMSDMQACVVGCEGVPDAQYISGLCRAFLCGALLMQPLSKRLQLAPPAF